MISHKPYVEFHARSAFSFLEGASLPAELARRAAELELPAFALLDRDSLSGAPQAHLAATKLGIQAHIGAEVTGPGGRRYPLIAETRQGYRNLCRLLTRMKMRAAKGEAAASFADLEEFSLGLVCLTGDECGPLAAALAEGREAARDCLHRLAGIYGGGNVFVELERHLHRRQEARNQAAIALALSLGLPLLATNGVNQAREDDRELQDVLTAVRHTLTLERAGRLLSRNAERHLKPAASMWELFGDLPESLENTLQLSRRIQFTLKDLGYQFPRYPVAAGESMDSFLRQRVDEGARRRYQPYREKERRQVERELALIEKLGLAGYFLIVWDIVEYCRREGILAQGRGSAANSAVCYSLGITAVDPVGMELLFERFLSEERGEWPDIDIDLPSGEQREQVIQHVYRTYGSRGAAMVANYITYRGRSAVRDVGKVLGYRDEELDRLSHLVSRWGWKEPDDTVARQFRDAGFDLEVLRNRKFMELCTRIRGLPRHLGQHSGGMVISQDELDSIVPLEPATMPGRVVVGWDKEDCADMGIIKVDLLGLGMLAVLKDTIAIVGEAYGEQVDLAHLPPNDAGVYDALCRADTVGMFQVESRAQMSCLPRMRPRRFYDIVVEVAIIRPGPIVGNLLHPYLRRRQGREPVEYPHPSLEPILRRTLGVPLFQEQLLRMAMTVAGFSGGEAEELRRALGFQRSPGRMADVEVKLRRGMQRNGITGAAEESVVKAIASFALYGFPESHAASFALIAYASAYLKVHYAAAFLAAMLNNQPMGFYSPNTLVKDAQRHGVRVLPVDVGVSGYECRVEQRDGQKCVRLGLNYVKHLRRQAAESILEQRARGPFASVAELARRVPLLNKDELTALAAIGALNSLNGERAAHRRSALWDAAGAGRRVGPLLEGVEALEAAGACPLDAMRPEERLLADLEGTSLSVGRHPVAYQRAALQRAGVTSAAGLRAGRNGTPVRAAGVIICRQRPETAKGFLFLSLEDETGISNIIVEPKVFDANRLTLLESPAVLVEGVLQNLDGVVSVRAARVTPLGFLPAALPSHDFC